MKKIVPVFLLLVFLAGIAAPPVLFAIAQHKSYQLRDRAIAENQLSYIILTPEQQVSENISEINDDEVMIAGMLYDIVSMSRAENGNLTMLVYSDEPETEDIIDAQHSGEHNPAQNPDLLKLIPVDFLPASTLLSFQSFYTELNFATTSQSTQSNTFFPPVPPPELF